MKKAIISIMLSICFGNMLSQISQTAIIPKNVEVEYDNIQAEIIYKNGLVYYLYDKDSIPFTGVICIYDYNHQAVKELESAIMQNGDYYIQNGAALKEVSKEISDTKLKSRYLSKKTSYKNGLIDGKDIAYHENGVIKFEQNYIKGVVNNQDVLRKILSKEKLTIDYIEGNCTNLGSLNNYNITVAQSKQRYYVKIISHTDRGDDAKLKVDGRIYFTFNNSAYISEFPEKFYRPVKTFNDRLYITFPTIPSISIPYENGKYTEEWLKLNMSNDKALELEKLIDFYSDSRENVTTYLITASDLRKGNVNKDNVKLYIKSEYRYKIRDYFIANKVRMIVFNNQTGQVYYDQLFAPVDNTNKKK